MDSAPPSKPRVYGGHLPNEHESVRAMLQPYFEPGARAFSPKEWQETHQRIYGLCAGGFHADIVRRALIGLFLANVVNAARDVRDAATHNEAWRAWSSPATRKRFYNVLQPYAKLSRNHSVAPAFDFLLRQVWLSALGGFYEDFVARPASDADSAADKELRVWLEVNTHNPSLEPVAPRYVVLVAPPLDEKELDAAAAFLACHDPRARDPALIQLVHELKEGKPTPGSDLRVPVLLSLASADQPFLFWRAWSEDHHQKLIHPTSGLGASFGQEVRTLLVLYRMPVTDPTAAHWGSLPYELVLACVANLWSSYRRAMPLAIIPDEPGVEDRPVRDSSAQWGVPKED